MMNILYKISAILLLGPIILFSNACSKDDDDNGGSGSGSGSGSGTTGSVLIIETGAKTIKTDEQLTYSAVLVSSDGSKSAATGVSWSTSDAQVAAISSSGELTVNVEGAITVSAEATIDGSKQTASTALSIVQKTTPFAVVPGAIVWTTDGGDIPLTTVYFGTSNPTYTYSSSDASIASVSSSGKVSFHKSGSCVLTVASNLSGNPSVKIPVVVVGLPGISLPVTRVQIYNSSDDEVLSHDMFRNKTEDFLARAFDSDGNEVSATFNWSIENSNFATVDQDGLLTSKSQIGRTVLYAETQGISGQVEVFIYPDSVIVLSPFYKQGVTAGSTHQLSATMYRFNSTTLELDPTPIQNPATGLTWTVLPTKVDINNPGIPIAPASVSGSGMVTVNNDVTIGDFVIIVAEIPGSGVEPGGSTFTVGF